MSNAIAATRYPGIAEYNQSVQNPATAFTDPELAAGTLAVSGLGLPKVLGGGFALTYTVSAGARKYAVRCFHRAAPDLEQRYASISDAIGGLRSEHFVSFEYQRAGVRVRSGVFPVVKMAWAEGQTLGVYLEDSYDDADAMRALSESFRALARFLSEREIAHGDLENGNMVVRDGALTLIDYDGMYVPGMALGNGNELGHAHFQHPGRTPAHFGPRIDDFSFILIDISLEALVHDASLYERLCNGDNILFQRSDFESPAASPVFAELRKIPALSDKVARFAAICARPMEEVPTLEAFLAGAGPAKPKPAAAARSRPRGVSNRDYLKAALAKGAAQPAPSPLQLAVARAATAPPSAPEAEPAAEQASSLPAAAVQWWRRAELYWAGLILVVILANI